MILSSDIRGPFVHGRRARAGFSLVEVTLAVAVAALAIITLLGLLPQGLEMSRKTSLATINSSVLEQIAHDLENARWASLPPPESDRRKYYNDEGIPQTSNSKEITFVALIEFPTTTTLPKSDTQAYLRRVVIKVAATADPSFNFTNTNRASYSTFNHLIAKTR